MTNDEYFQLDNDKLPIVFLKARQVGVATAGAYAMISAMREAGAPEEEIERLAEQMDRIMNLPEVVDGYDEEE